MRDVKYIVPEHCRDIKVAQPVIDDMVRRCAERSCFARVILLGVFDGLTCFAWCGGLLPQKGGAPIVFTVSSDGVVEDLDATTSQGVIRYVVETYRMDRNLFSRDE